jgi:hypothetical protein
VRHPLGDRLECSRQMLAQPFDLVSAIRRLSIAVSVVAVMLDRSTPLGSFAGKTRIITGHSAPACIFLRTEEHRSFAGRETIAAAAITRVLD